MSGTVEPVVQTIEVPGDPESVFEAFTARVGEWWPLATHSLSSGECGAPARTCAFEGRVGGALYEVMANGERRPWGRVLEWVPGETLRFSWHVGVAEELATEVEVTFGPSGETATSVTLRHSGWERHGDRAHELRSGYDSGWAGILRDDLLPFVERLQTVAAPDVVPAAAKRESS